jgi:hypothetical protein
MTPITARAVIGVLAAASLLTGCGSGNRTDAATTSQLRQDMQTLAAAAAARNYPAALSALAALNADAAAAQGTGKLSDIQLAQIRAAAAKVQADLTTATAQPTTAPATPQQTGTGHPPTVPRPGKSKHKGGEGNGGGDGGD